MEQAEGVVAERRVRRWRSIAEKRRIVELTCRAGSNDDAFRNRLSSKMRDSLSANDVY